MENGVISSMTSSMATVPAQRFTMFTHAVLFVLGFCTVFIVGWSGVARPAAELFFLYRPLLARISGLVVVLSGLATMGLPWLHWDVYRGSAFILSLLLGAFLAVGWTPCVDTTLRTILTLGFDEETAGQGLFLLTGYALGLATPFLALGLLFDQAIGIMRHLRQHRRLVQLVNGLLLVGMGLLLFSNQMPQIAVWTLNNGLYLDVSLGDAPAPIYLLAVVAGLLSFLSLCVLPLVPAYLGYLSGRAVDAGTFRSRRS